MWYSICVFSGDLENGGEKELENKKKYKRKKKPRKEKNNVEIC